MWPKAKLTIILFLWTAVPAVRMGPAPMPQISLSPWWMPGICPTFLSLDKRQQPWTWQARPETGNRFGRNRICWCGWEEDSIFGGWITEEGQLRDPLMDP